AVMVMGALERRPVRVEHKRREAEKDQDRLNPPPIGAGRFTEFSLLEGGRDSGHANGSVAGFRRLFDFAPQCYWRFWISISTRILPRPIVHATSFPDSCRTRSQSPSCQDSFCSATTGDLNSTAPMTTM